MPLFRDCRTMFSMLSSDRNEELAKLKKITSAMRVNTGAMLRSWSAMKRLKLKLRGAAVSAVDIRSVSQ